MKELAGAADTSGTGEISSDTFARLRWRCHLWCPKEVAVLLPPNGLQKRQLCPTLDGMLPWDS